MWMNVIGTFWRAMTRELIHIVWLDCIWWQIYEHYHSFYLNCKTKVNLLLGVEMEWSSWLDSNVVLAKLNVFGCRYFQVSFRISSWGCLNVVQTFGDAIELMLLSQQTCSRLAITENNHFCHEFFEAFAFFNPVHGIFISSLLFMPSAFSELNICIPLALLDLFPW